MPYIVTTKRPVAPDEDGHPFCAACSHYHEGACLCPECGRPTPCRAHSQGASTQKPAHEVTSRRAVSTLEGACGPYATPPSAEEESMAARVDRATTYDYLRLWTPGTSPLVLSGGTVVEVERVGWSDLARQADEPSEARHVEGAWPSSHLASHRRAVLAAFNSDGQ